LMYLALIEDDKLQSVWPLCELKLLKILNELYFFNIPNYKDIFM